jgi:hypothetical protein
MDLLKIFKLNDKEYQINIQGTNDEPLFQANQIAKMLEIRNIRQNLNDFTPEEKLVYPVYTRGGNQHATFITEIGLYRLIGRSKSPIAREFQKWTVKTIREIVKTGVYKLNENNEIEKKLLEHQNGLKINKIFLQTNDNKNIVYLCKIKEINNKILIKIGSSQNISDRINKLSTLFSSQILLIQVLQSNNYIKFEKFLHNHEFIKKLYVPTMMKSNTNSTETYLVSNEELDEILKIMNINKYQFDDDKNKVIQEIQLVIEKENILLKQKEAELKKKEVEIKQKETEIKQKETEIKEKELKKIEIQNNSEEKNNIDELIKTCNYELRTRKNGSKTPIIYQYSPDDLKTPIKIYDSPIDVERDFKLLSPSQLKRASVGNTIYKNFRWLSLKRSEQPPEQLPETKIIKHSSPDIKYVAMIDIKKMKILEVFSNQKHAAEARNLKSISSLTRAIKQYSLSSGHYWKHFDDCSEEMKKAFLLTSKLPQKFTSPKGKVVEQIDPKTNEVIEKYYSNRDICKKFQMSVLSLKKASTTGNIHHGYKWRITA